jgi:hypothetical protein
MKSPKGIAWRTVSHNGESYMVRECDGVVWLSRIRDRAFWLFDPAPTAPTWAREQVQQALL